jgi:hypothetical protein
MIRIVEEGDPLSLVMIDKGFEEMRQILEWFIDNDVPLYESWGDGDEMDKVGLQKVIARATYLRMTPGFLVRMPHFDAHKLILTF